MSALNLPPPPPCLMPKGEVMGYALRMMRGQA